MRRLLIVLALCNTCAWSCKRHAPAPDTDEESATAGQGPGGVAVEAGPGTVLAAMRFVDVAPEAGLTDVIYGGGPNKDHILESTGSGVALFDFDNDGRLDIYLTNAWLLDEEPPGVKIRGRNLLYRNLGDWKFVDVAREAGVDDDGWGCGVCAGDYDNDGLMDLYVTNFGPNRLFRNRGDGTFEETSQAAGVDEPGWGAGASFFDADGDGDLDLYVANYIDCTMDEVLAATRTNLWRDTAKVMTGPFGLRGGRDHFFRNNGDGTFTDATDEVGMTDLGEGYGLGVLASDLDWDGDVDVYVANDSNPNYLYRNEGDGTFTDIGAWCGAGFSAEGNAQAGMGVDGGDFDGDGREDLFVTNFARDYCTLYRNMGKLFFTDVTTSHEIRKATFTKLSWGCAFFDADCDADVDLVVASGHIYPQVDEYAKLAETYRQAMTFLRNDDGRFVEAFDAEGGPLVSDLVCGRGLAVGDPDDDGDLDVVVSAIDSAPLVLRNDTVNLGHWVKVRLLNEKGAYDLNASVIVTTAGGVVQRREVRSGGSYQSQNALDLHFGLGTADEIETLEVRWSDGTLTTQHDLAVDRLMTIKRPGASR